MNDNEELVLRQQPLIMFAALVATGSHISACGPLDRPATTRTAAQALCALGYSSISLRTLPTGHHLVSVTVNGRPATFMVDTGAGGTVIHRGYLEAFGLRAQGGRTAKAFSQAGASEASLVRVTELTIARTRTALTGIYTLDLSLLVNATSGMEGGPIHGIIGHDVMRAQHAIVDVQQERLYLKPLQGEQQTGC